MGLFDDFYYDDSASMTSAEAVKLVTALAEEIPEILQEIAPDGWAKSAYRRFIHRFNRKSDVVNRRRNLAIFHYHIHKSQHPGTPFNADDYLEKKDLGALFPDSIHYEATILFILCIITKGLSRERTMLYKPDRSPRILDIYDINQALPIVLAEKNLWPKEKIDNLFLLDIHDVYMDADTTPFYTGAFRALKKLDYDWEYFDFEFATIIGNIEEYHQLKWSPTARSDKGKTASQVLKEIVDTLKDLSLASLEPLDEKAICNAFNRKQPSNAVLAYLTVFGELPYKYPLQVADYKNLDD